VEVVRQPIDVRARSHRGSVERLGLRFPRAAALLVRAGVRLSPRSRLRQAMVRYALRRSIEAVNRGDLEAAFMLISPDFETVPPPELVGLGFDPVYRGREGRLRFHRMWIAELGDFQQEIKEVIDCGDRVLLLAQMKGTGSSSGAGFEDEAAYLFTISAGRMIREQEFRSHQEAVKAAGLSE
jgi:ketosteroid isomerase-like protein